MINCGDDRDWWWNIIFLKFKIGIIENCMNDFVNVVCRW